MTENTPITAGELSIDTLPLSTKTRNNLKYYGYSTVNSLQFVDIFTHPHFAMFSNKLKNKIHLAVLLAFPKS